MSRITVLGGTGYAGQHIAAEATARGHHVIAVARQAPKEPLDGVSYVTGDVTRPEFLEDLLAKTDVVILALSARGDMRGRVVEVAAELIPSAARHNVRLGVLGGAGSLKVSEDGPRLIDTDAFPAEWKPESIEMIQVLEDLEAAEDTLQWFYISPAASFGVNHPGERTGGYRTTGDVLMYDDAGRSELSGADLAIAVVDEVEQHRHRNHRFAVGY